jgi:ketosteroid isomerase-like protein
MLLQYIYEKRARATFDRVNRHEFDAILDDALPTIRHRFAGQHALGGTRNDTEHLKLWFERLARVVPDLKITVTDVWVTGTLNDATVIVRWVGAATLLDGEPYSNHGVHVIHLLKRKIASIDVNEDSQAVSEAMRRQAASGIAEASAAPIES